MMHLAVVTVNTANLKINIENMCTPNEIISYRRFDDMLPLLIEHLEKVYDDIKSQQNDAHIIFNLQEYALGDGIGITAFYQQHGNWFLTAEQKNIALETVAKFTEIRDCHIILPLSHTKAITNQNKLDKLLARRHARLNEYNQYTDKSLDTTVQAMLAIAPLSNIFSESNHQIRQVRNTAYLLGKGRKLAKQDKMLPFDGDVENYRETFFRPGNKFKLFKLEINNKIIPIVHEICYDHSCAVAKTHQKKALLHLVSSSSCNTESKNMCAPFLAHTDYQIEAESFYKTDYFGDIPDDINMQFYQAPYQGELEFEDNFVTRVYTDFV